MNVVSGSLLRIFLDEDNRVGRQPAYEAIVIALRDAGFGGATIFKGIEGFGAGRKVQSTRAMDAASSLPVLVEVVEESDKIMSIVPVLRDMLDGGLMTIERLSLVRAADSGSDSGSGGAR